MSEPRRMQNPDGQMGIVLQWPIGASQAFRMSSATGEVLDYVNLTPLLLDNGEVRFYAPSALRPAEEIRRSGALK